MSKGKVVNDLSGVKSNQKINKSIPAALELRESDFASGGVTTSIGRDSGCYTGSPVINASCSGSHNSTIAGSGSRCFVFNTEPASPSITSSPSRPEATEQEVMSDGAVRPTSLVFSEEVCNKQVDSLLSGDEDMDDDDEVFHMSHEDSVFFDSGIQEPTQSKGNTSGKLHDESPKKIGRSMFYIDTSRGANTDEDDDSSTDDEFTTAEFELQGSPTSRPINIPPRSQNPTPNQGVDDEIECSNMRYPTTTSGNPMVIMREAGVQTTALRGAIRQERPYSNPVRAYAIRNERVYSQSIEGSTGPLPDIVQHEIRNRAYSESSIYTSQMAQNVGRSLRDICDQFSEIHLHRRVNLNMLQQVHAGRVNHQRLPDCPSSYPERGPRRRQSFLSSLQEKFFSQ